MLKGREIRNCPTELTGEKQGMWFAAREVIVGIVVLVIALLIFRSVGGTKNRTVAVLCIILGLVGVYMLLVRGLGLF